MYIHWVLTSNNFDWRQEVMGGDICKGCDKYLLNVYVICLWNGIYNIYVEILYIQRVHNEFRCLILNIFWQLLRDFTLWYMPSQGSTFLARNQRMHHSQLNMLKIDFLNSLKFSYFQTVDLCIIFHSDWPKLDKTIP